MRTWMKSQYALAPLLVAGSMAAVAPAAAQAVTVTAVQGTQAPALDGMADDPIWQTAPVTEVDAVKGVNFTEGATTGTVRAAYVGDTLYMLIQWQDPTQSYQRSPYQKQEDGSWAPLRDPNDRGGDNNLYYEDKAALIWNIDNSIFGFERRGCQMACHSGEPGKPYGNKYTEEEGELGDMWHVKNVRTLPVGQIDDQYLDHVRYDKEASPEAGRHGDPNTGGGYRNIALTDGMPEVMSQDAQPANKDGTYWVTESEAVPFDDSRFQPGDEVASIQIAPYTGDRGDISAGGQWADGTWTVELSRKLVTEGQFDVQFDDMAGEYYFGISFFDNAQVRHAYQEAPLVLVFEQ